ncbi:MAG: RidA family protein [Bacteroidota bacterium]
MEVALMKRVAALEAQVAALQKGNKEAYNSDVVYNTKDTFGFAQLVEITGGKILFLSGMTPWDQQMTLKSVNLVEQMEAALDNILKLLVAKGLGPESLVFLRVYVAKPNYYEEMANFSTILKKKLGEAITCAVTLVGVTGLAEPNQLVEVEAVALI